MANDVPQATPDYRLTTVDNPFNPFTQWDAWYAWDRDMGYNTPSLLARVVVTSDNLSEADQYQALQMGIDEVVRYNVSGMHRKVSEESFNDAPSS